MLRQGFKTKREAETTLAAAQQSVEQGSVVSKSSMKVDAFLDQWLASQQGRLKTSTHHSYVVTSKRIRSGLGHVQVQALTPLQIETFYSELLDHGRADGAGLSPKTGCGAVRCSGCGGRTSTSTLVSWRSCRPSRTSTAS
jgi:hypothetical protein